jgi:hypothetical protein
VLAEMTAQLEERTVQDLEAQGFEVVRMAGAFPRLSQVRDPYQYSMNFINAEQGKGQDGKVFSIVLDGDPRAMEYVKQTLTPEATGIERLHFIEGITEASGWLGGGANCRIKSEGHL